MKGNVYKITSPTGKIYVGSTSREVEARWKQYYSLDCKPQRKLYNSLKKHGVDNHVFEKIWEGDIKLMLKMEATLGREYKVLDTNLGLNLALPKESDIFQCKSLETRIKHSKAKSKAVMQMDMNYNELKQYFNANEAAKCLNLLKENIQKCCRKFKKETGGFRWKYIN